MDDRSQKLHREIQENEVNEWDTIVLKGMKKVQALKVCVWDSSRLINLREAKIL